MRGDTACTTKQQFNAEGTHGQRHEDNQPQQHSALPGVEGVVEVNQPVPEFYHTGSITHQGRGVKMNDNGEREIKDYTVKEILGDFIVPRLDEMHSWQLQHEQADRVQFALINDSIAHVSKKTDDLRLITTTRQRLVAKSLIAAATVGTVATASAAIVALFLR